MSGILIAGIGNIFEGDDAFGVEVVQRLSTRELPPGVTAVDFGIRGIDLVYALLAGHDAVVMVDAAPRGEAPGTVSVAAVDAADAAATQAPAASPHGLDPASALALARAWGNETPPIFLVACEPLTLGGEVGLMGLSDPVAAAVEPAIATVQALVQRLQSAQCLEVGAQRRRMTMGKISPGLLALAVAALIAVNAKDVARYIRISSM